MTSVEGTTWVSIGGPVSFTSGEDFEANTRIEALRVTVQWAKLEAGTGACPSDPSAALPDQDGVANSAAHIETRFRLVRSDVGGDVIHDLASNSFGGTQGLESYVSVTWNDSPGADPSPYGIPGASSPLLPLDGPPSTAMATMIHSAVGASRHRPRPPASRCACAAGRSKST